MYKSKLSLRDTERAIKKLKDYFKDGLERELHLERISAPLFVYKDTGLNDDLNGTERAVGFDKYDKRIEIVQSLAKWKRNALSRYKFKPGEGLYTDMNAIRMDEIYSPIHSMYVDQWDWEKVITKEQRTDEFLDDTVRRIYQIFLQTSLFIKRDYPILTNSLPDEIKFITSQELLDIYPTLTPKERENEYAKIHKAIFIKHIGGELSDGTIHDGRAPDYDDWKLNGDIILWNDVLEMAYEVSSMGIRVSPKSLDKQLTICKADDRRKLPFHQALLEGKLPYTIGGGIGQSRLCMFFLNKVHIGEVQASTWDDFVKLDCKQKGIELL